jgi:hypothetical protein
MYLGNMGNKEQYRKICAAHPEMLVFTQAWWLDAVCGEWDAAIAMKGGHVKGVWAYPIEKKMGVSLIRSQKLTPYIGPQFFYPPDVKESNKDSYEHETLAELIKQLPVVQVWGLAVQPGLKQAGIFKNYGLTTTVQQTFILDITPDKATIFSGFKESTRRNLKQAEKECTITGAEGHIQQLFEFHKATLGRKDKGISHTEGDLQKLVKASIDNKSGAVWMAKTGETIEAIAWYVWDKNCCYFVMGAKSPTATNSGAMSLLHWYAINHAQQTGISVFDFEGSMDEGVERFFRSFGGKRELYLILQKNNSPLWKVKQLLLG